MWISKLSLSQMVSLLRSDFVFIIYDSVEPELLSTELSQSSEYHQLLKQLQRYIFIRHRHRHTTHTRDTKSTHTEQPMHVVSNIVWNTMLMVILSISCVPSVFVVRLLCSFYFWLPRVIGIFWPQIFLRMGNNWAKAKLFIHNIGQWNVDNFVRGQGILIENCLDALNAIWPSWIVAEYSVITLCITSICSVYSSHLVLP